MKSKSGRIRSTPGWCVLGEQHPAVDDEQPAGVLEDGHVAADLAEAAQRRRRAGRRPGAPAAGRARGAVTQVEPRHSGRGEVGTQLGAARSSVAGSSGSRGRPASGRPSRSSAGLDHDHSLGSGHDADGRPGAAPWWIARRRATSPASKAASIASQPVGHQVAGDADEADRPDGEQRQVERVVAGVVREVAATPSPAARRQVALGVLDGHDARVLGQPDAASRWRSARRCAPGCRRASPAGRWRRRPP